MGKEVIRVLPAFLRRALLCESRLPLLRENVFFRSWVGFHWRSFERACCDAFHASSYHPDEDIFAYGEFCSSMYLARTGTMMYRVYAGTVFERLDPKSLKSFVN